MRRTITADGNPHHNSQEMGKEAPPGFEPRMADLQSASAPPQVLINWGASTSDAERLAFCLALLRQQSPDLALLAERWNELPEAVRAGIMAMVRATGFG